MRGVAVNEGWGVLGKWFGKLGEKCDQKQGNCTAIKVEGADS